MSTDKNNTRPPQRAARPKLAASIILLDGEPGDERVVMGARNKALKFMPGAVVFPGGRVDKHDGKIKCVDGLDEITQSKLISNMSGRPVEQTARSLAVAAVRELGEETGLLMGGKTQNPPQHDDWEPFCSKQIAPAVSSLRLLARAVTPTSLDRRFDTWFFVTRLENLFYVPKQGFEPSGELENLQWIRPKDALNENLRSITRMILTELMERLEYDRELNPSTPIPAFTSPRGDFLCKRI